MSLSVGDRVRVPDDTTVEVGDLTVRLSAGLILRVTGVREGAALVVWLIHDRKGEKTNDE